MSIIIISQKFYFMSIKTLSYKPTFLQKFLGQNYKWWFLLQYEYKRSNGHFYSFIFVNIVRAIEFLVVIYVWKINNSPAEIITYLCLGRVFERMISSPFGVVLGSYIDSGKITTHLVLPQKSLLYYFISDLGFNQMRQFLGGMITLILAILIFNSDVKLNFSFGWLILFLPMATIIRFYANILIGLIAFWIRERANNSSIMGGIYMLMGILAGEIIPLNLVLNGNLSFLQFTPFAYFLHLPMQIYLGKYSPIEIFYVFLGGIFWCIILYFLAKLVFKMGLKRNESVGL